MVVKAQVEPLASPADRAIPVAHANGTLRPSRDPMLGTSMQSPTMMPVRRLKRFGPPPGRLFPLENLN
jgi:hypothetical protein